MGRMVVELPVPGPEDDPVAAVPEPPVLTVEVVFEELLSEEELVLVVQLAEDMPGPVADPSEDEDFDEEETDAAAFISG